MNKKVLALAGSLLAATALTGTAAQADVKIGLLGGITNGEDIVIRMAVKPTPTVSIEQDSVDKSKMREERLAAITRRDATICPRIYPVAEAMVRIAVLDALFMMRGWERMQKGT